jgi:hypothetical protein
VALSLVAMTLAGACGDAGSAGELTLRDRIVLALRPDSLAAPPGDQQVATTPEPRESAATTAAPGPPGLAAAEREAVQSAARDYVRSNGVVRDFSVQIEASNGDWVRAMVVPARAETDPAYLYLRKAGGQWRGVLIGTGFTPEDYDELRIPRSIRPAGARE